MRLEILFFHLLEPYVILRNLILIHLTNMEKIKCVIFSKIDKIKLDLF